MNLLRQLGLVVEPDAAHPLSSLFHRLSRIIRDDQEFATLPSNTPVRDAIHFMQEKGFSQIPVRAIGKWRQDRDVSEYLDGH